MPISKINPNSLAANSVTSAAIANGEIALVDLAINSVGTDQIVDGAITGDKIGLTAINANNIVTGAITGDKIAPGAIPEVPQILKPSITSPSNTATDILDTQLIVASEYRSLYGIPQANAEWQLSTSSTFAFINVENTISGSNTEFQLNVSSGLATSNTYYARVRYSDTSNNSSQFSDTIEFATAAAFTNFIATPTATPAIGGALEGGFHTGLIWNQVTQSATSTTIGTGSKTFTTTDDMAATPLFYSGQAVEVRSRANPDTARMIGTVTAASGTTLTVNVTSVDGSGTLTDWSVMAKFRVIVAPKSSGDGSALTYKNAQTAAPSATGTLTEGLKATLALVADGNSTVYPAAHFCNNLSIGGYSDWYLPARDELELIYRNLKPVTNNNTTTGRSDSPTPNYTNLGSIGTGGSDVGLNYNSDPQGVAYTSTVPGQTSVADFQSGGAEAMSFGATAYWSSTEYSATTAWVQWYHSSFPANQEPIGKDSSYRARAVRRSII